VKVKIYNSQTKENLQEFDLASAIESRGKCTVGRSLTSDLILESSRVNRIHGIFIYQAGSYYFVDASSSNSSLINSNVNLKHQAYLLKAGDVLQIGEFILTTQPIAEQKVLEDDDQSSNEPLKANQQIKSVSPMTLSQKFYQSHELRIAEEFEQALEANSLEKIKELLDKIIKLEESKSE